MRGRLEWLGSGWGDLGWQVPVRRFRRRRRPPAIFTRLGLRSSCVFDSAYGDVGVEVAVERLDDVSFEIAGDAVELLQTKHHLRRTADLGDLSADIWKTLRIWSERALDDPNLPSRTRLVLVTTGFAQPGQAAWLLRPDRVTGEARADNARAAAELLTAAAERSDNQALKPAFEAFLKI